MSLSSPSPSETEVALSRGDDPASPRRPRIGGTGMQATPWLQAPSTLARAGAEGPAGGNNFPKRASFALVSFSSSVSFITHGAGAEGPAGAAPGRAAAGL